EIAIAYHIAVGAAPLEACLAADADLNGQVSVGELLLARNTALGVQLGSDGSLCAVPHDDPPTGLPTTVRVDSVEAAPDAEVEIEVHLETVDAQVSDIQNYLDVAPPEPVGSAYFLETEQGQPACTANPEIQRSFSDF